MLHKVIHLTYGWSNQPMLNMGRRRSVPQSERHGAAVRSW